MEVVLAERRLLIDCGLFQGSRTLEELNHRAFAFEPGTIDAVILTHAHIDHCGLLPKLVASGFTGKVWCTPPTRDLLAFLLPDAGRVQENDTARRNRRSDRAGEPPLEPIYTERDGSQAALRACDIPLETWFEPVPGIRARLWNAAHILGSASVELSVGGLRLLFSGDLGPEHKAFYPDPVAPAGFDHVICESTYGDQRHKQATIRQRRTLLQGEIKQAMALGGNLIIPVFALERTQELLLDIASLLNAGRLPRVPVYIDSPLAGKATEVFGRYAGGLEDMGQGRIFNHPSFHYVESSTDSIALNAVSGAIILAASGMCEGGRIRHHLWHNLARTESTILFVGFQAAGTLGRTILDGAKRIRISGRTTVVRARIRQIDSYAGHADREGLISWIEDRHPITGSLFLTHGEARTIESLRAELAARGAAHSIMSPDIGDCYHLARGSAATLIKGSGDEAREAIGSDWRNMCESLLANLKEDLKALPTSAARSAALQRMTDALAGPQS
ncbi:MBL fold metallo-hydrolase [Sphingobium sp.]|uniref:MBL fold metallo-hydrolase n=1 Tax=Sphingobium sp. TaxID=1912891 RepID=UPI002579B478|nr:MBL fold metallo-hydrolase [Sphingobium sp.]